MQSDAQGARRHAPTCSGTRHAQGRPPSLPLRPTVRADPSRCEEAPLDMQYRPVPERAWQRHREIEQLGYGQKPHVIGVTRSRRSILLAESTLGPDALARDGAAARLRAAGECALAPQSWLSGAYLRRLWGSSPPRRASRHGVVARRGVRLWIKVQSANTGGSLSHGGLKIRATPSGRPALGSSSPLLVLAAHLCS